MSENRPYRSYTTCVTINLRTLSLCHIHFPCSYRMLPSHDMVEMSLQPRISSKQPTSQYTSKLIHRQTLINEPCRSAVMSYLATIEGISISLKKHLILVVASCSFVCTRSDTISCPLDCNQGTQPCSLIAASTIQATHPIQLR